jgi:hypothetical protein
MGPTELDLRVPDQAKFVICNHTIEQDHRFVKRRMNPGLGFGTFPTAQRTMGYEVMHMLHKGQLEGLAKGDILAQTRALTSCSGWPPNECSLNLSSHFLRFLHHYPADDPGR